MNIYPDIEYLPFTEKVLFFKSEKELPVHIYKQDHPAPTIILGHSCGGPSILFGWPDIVRSWGYNVVVPNSFSARGHDNICNNPKVISFNSRAEDFERVAEWIKQQPWHKGKIGIFGFSHGAIGGMFHATSHNTNKNISAVQGWYPHCGYGGYKPNVPMQIHIGALDNWTPASTCVSIAGGNTEVIVLPNTHHAFDVGYGIKQMYGHTVGSATREYTIQATENTKEFFRKHLND